MDKVRFQELLDGHHQWPEAYVFKFVVPQASLDALKALFPGTEPVVKPSAKGNYVAVTYTQEMASSKAVLDVYEAVAVVPGLMSL